MENDHEKLRQRLDQFDLEQEEIDNKVDWLNKQIEEQTGDPKAKPLDPEERLRLEEELKQLRHSKAEKETLDKPNEFIGTLKPKIEPKIDRRPSVGLLDRE